eukprot:1139655-Pelagomonas_calceolata.AAC.2
MHVRCAEGAPPGMVHRAERSKRRAGPADQHDLQGCRGQHAALVELKPDVLEERVLQHGALIRCPKFQSLETPTQQLADAVHSSLPSLCTITLCPCALRTHRPCAQQPFIPVHNNPPSLRTAACRSCAMGWMVFDSNNCTPACTLP